MEFSNFKITTHGNKYYKAINEHYIQTSILTCVEVNDSIAKFIIDNPIQFYSIENDIKNSNLPKIRNWFSAIEQNLVRLHFTGINFYDFNKKPIDWELSPGNKVKLLVKLEGVVDTFDIRRPYFKIIQAKVYPENDDSEDEIEVEIS